MKRILITGIPGMGKTTLGKEFMIKRNFQHIDMEGCPTKRYFLRSNPEDFISSIESTNVVITWGFYPPNDIAEILFLKNNGFKLVWLDGDRDSAFREYKKRVIREDPVNLEHHIENFFKQIERINDNNVIQEVVPVIINTFNEDKKFRDLTEIVNEIDP